MKSLAPRRFSALLSGAGIHVVEYRRGRGGLRIVRYFQDLGPRTAPEDAAERLADLLEANGGRGGRLSLSVAGFGTYHHLLTLPPSSRDILLPVVTRELRRFYPDLFHEGAVPLIDFAEIDSTGQGRAARQTELLAAAVPETLMTRVHGALRARGVALEHWTILPRALQRLHDTFGDAFHTEASLLMVPRAPVLGFFHEGELRLFTEPMLGHQSAPDAEIDAVGEQVERGALFLRQQFRGAAVDRLLASVESGSQLQALTDRLRAGGTMRVEPFGPPDVAPGALAALGASLDATAANPLNLLPPELRLPTAAERSGRALALAGMAIVIGAAASWAASGLQLEAQAGERLERVERDLAGRASAFAEIRPLVEERQGHVQRAALLARIRAEHEQLPEMLWVLAAAPPQVDLTALTLVRSDDGWLGSVSGISRAETSSIASGAVDALFRELSAGLPPGGVDLSRLAYVEPPARDEVPPDVEIETRSIGGEPIAISFEMSFILPAVEGSSP